MIDRYKHQQLRIGSVSPQQINAWATKILPNGEIVGEVTKPYTFHYKTNKQARILSLLPFLNNEKQFEKNESTARTTGLRTRNN